MLEGIEEVDEVRALVEPRDPEILRLEESGQLVADPLDDRAEIELRCDAALDRPDQAELGLAHGQQLAHRGRLEREAPRACDARAALRGRGTLGRLRFGRRLPLRTRLAGAALLHRRARRMLLYRRARRTLLRGTPPGCCGLRGPAGHQTPPERR